MTAAEMSDCIAFMQVVDPAGAARIQYAGKLAVNYWQVRNWPVGSVVTAALVACEIQCIVEAMRAERAGGILIRRHGA